MDCPAIVVCFSHTAQWCTHCQHHLTHFMLCNKFHCAIMFVFMLMMEEEYLYKSNPNCMQKLSWQDEGTLTYSQDGADSAGEWYIYMKTRLQSQGHTWIRQKLPVLFASQFINVFCTFSCQREISNILKYFLQLYMANSLMWEFPLW